MWSEQGETITINMPVDAFAQPGAPQAAPLRHGDFAIRVREVSKIYLIYERPEDRLKQMIVPRLLRFTGGRAKPYYREFAAIRGVSFDIKRGETIGIVGRNGSGKSTLLQIICGI